MEKYARIKDGRLYKIITIARSFNEQTGQWSDMNVVHEPVEPGYCSYVMPLEQFEREFRKF